MSYIIMEAWLSSFPMIPISLVYSFSGMNDSFMNGVGVPSVPSFFCSDIDHNDHYYHDPYSDMPRLSLVDKARYVSFGKYRQGIRKSGW